MRQTEENKIIIVIRVLEAQIIVWCSHSMKFDNTLDLGKWVKTRNLIFSEKSEIAYMQSGHSLVSQLKFPSLRSILDIFFHREPNLNILTTLRIET